MAQKLSGIKDVGPMVLIGAGFYLRIDEIEAIHKLQAGVGSTAVLKMVNDTRANFEKTKMRPRLWDLTGNMKRRSVVVMKSGDMYLSFLSPRAVIRRMRKEDA